VIRIRGYSNDLTLLYAKTYPGSNSNLQFPLLYAKEGSWKCTVDDFNKNDLFCHREEYLKNPTSIVIYHIEHTFMK